jgi:hypothetical protein
VSGVREIENEKQRECLLVGGSAQSELVQFVIECPAHAIVESPEIKERKEALVNAFIRESRFENIHSFT